MWSFKVNSWDCKGLFEKWRGMEEGCSKEELWGLC